MSKINLEARIDRIMGFAPDHGAAAVKRSGLKLRKEVKLMDTTTTQSRPKDWLRRTVLDMIEQHPIRDWTPAEMDEQIGHNNRDSVNSTLSDLHRGNQYPVRRVAPGRYRYVTPSTKNNLVEKVERITRGDGLRAGDLLEVVFVRGDKTLAVDSNDNLLVISARTVENL